MMRTYRRGLVAATLLGLVAMHGVGSHGVHGAEGDTTVMAHGATRPDHSLAAMADEVARPGPTHDGGLGLEVLCVAILAGLVLTIWLLRRVRTSPGRLGRRGRAYSPILPRARDPDPPTLAELSILRC